MLLTKEMVLCPSDSSRTQRPSPHFLSYFFHQAMMTALHWAVEEVAVRRWMQRASQLQARM